MLKDFIKFIRIQNKILIKPTEDLIALINSEAYFLHEFKDLLIFRGVTSEEIKKAIIKELKLRWVSI